MLGGGGKGKGPGESTLPNVGSSPGVVSRDSMAAVIRAFPLRVRIGRGHSFTRGARRRRPFLQVGAAECTVLDPGNWVERLPEARVDLYQVLSGPLVVARAHAVSETDRDRRAALAAVGRAVLRMAEQVRGVRKHVRERLRPLPLPVREGILGSRAYT